MPTPREQRIEAFARRIGEVMEEFRDVVGPGECKYCGREPDCPHTPEEAAVPMDGVFLSRWVLVHSWARMDDVTGYWDWTTSQDMVTTDAIGLLTVALDDAREAVKRR